MSIQLFQPVFPIAWFSAVVRDGKNADVGRHLEIDDVIRKASYGAASNWQVCRQTSDRRAGMWHPPDLINGRVNGVQELDAQVLSPTLVPSAREAVLGVRLVVKANARIHRRRSSASARRRTSSHGTPADSSARARRARRSISVAHAASTSAGRSAAASSRLAKSSAATSARSFRGNDKASRSKSCARDGMPPFYTGQAAQHPVEPDAVRRCIVTREAWVNRTVRLLTVTS